MYDTMYMPRVRQTQYGVLHYCTRIVYIAAVAVQYNCSHENFEAG